MPQKFKRRLMIYMYTWAMYTYLLKTQLVDLYNCSGDLRLLLFIEISMTKKCKPGAWCWTCKTSLYLPHTPLSESAPDDLDLVNFSFTLCKHFSKFVYTGQREDLARVGASRGTLKFTSHYLILTLPRPTPQSALLLPRYQALNWLPKRPFLNQNHINSDIFLPSCAP